MIPAKHVRMAWCAALAALCGALVFFNLPDAAPGETALSAGRPQSASYASDAPTGHEVGERPEDFALRQMDGEDFVLSGQRGKVVVINLWATWCTPCVKELPYFDRLQREYADAVSVLAIHSDLITDDVDDYLSNFDYLMPFAIDDGGGVIASLGGSTMLPQTIVLDRFGVVTYNKVGSLTYEALEEVVRAAIGDQGTG